MEDIIVEMPYKINQKITFKRENSPIRHGKTIGYKIYYLENKIIVSGVKLKTKSGDIVYVSWDEIIDGKQ